MYVAGKHVYVIFLEILKRTLQNCKVKNKTYIIKRIPWNAVYNNFGKVDFVNVVILFSFGGRGESGGC